MEKEAVVKMLREHEPELRMLGAAHVSLFGSVLRGEQRADSDVDLFIEYDDPRFSLIELARLQEEIGKLLPSKVDVMTRDSLHPLIREEIIRSAVRVF